MRWIVLGATVAVLYVAFGTGDPGVGVLADGKVLIYRRKTMEHSTESFVVARSVFSVSGAEAEAANWVE